MKKTAAAAALVLVGMLLALAILPGLGFDFSFLGAFRLKSTSYTVSESFSAIDVQGGACSISVSSSYDSQCQVYIRELGGRSRSARVVDGALTVTGGGERSWLEKLHFLDAGERYISIYLPEESACTLRLATTSGDIYVSSEMGFGSTSLETDSGDISFYGSVDGTLTAETGSGEIYLSGVDAAALTARTGSGELDLDTVNASGPVELTAGSGDIWLWDCDGESFRIETGSGDVSGTFLTPKDFVTETGSGSVNAPLADKSAGLCQVKTGSGDIWLHVEDEQDEY